uniref:ATP-dependent rRNA helicase SPB4-like C-terminal extension domain-containing protein n=1 Tax=Timema monikensis TaxID=170555 RepID=A0A7R9E2L7_9NEOP|nr:unnamed protein product [Timema monikensis]
MLSPTGEDGEIEVRISVGRAVVLGSLWKLSTAMIFSTGTTLSFPVLFLYALAYVSWVRFYASYPKEVREVFCFKALHMGHYAKSFALRDPPKHIAGIGKREGLAGKKLNRRTVERLDAYSGRQSQSSRRNWPHNKLWKSGR